jgi:hypothetical protein
MPRQLQGSWLDHYLDYIDETEIPRDYNLWAAISAIASSLKRRVFIWRNFVQYFPNQYVILVGPPGIGKGSAIHPVMSIVKETGSVNYLSDKITAEKIIEKLAAGFLKVQPSLLSLGGTGGALTQDHSATLIAKELPVFLSSSEWLHSLLCQLWDEHEFEYETKNKGSYKITDLCVSMLGGCVPDYVRSLSRDQMAPITGGFTARTIFVYATKKHKLIPEGWGKPSKSINTLRDSLVNDLKHISSLEGEMRLDINAQKLWNKTYAEHNKQGDFDSDAAANFTSRISAHVIKTAIAVSVSESDSLTITEDQLQRSIGYIEEIRKNVDIVFRTVGESPLAVIQDKVQEFLRIQGIASRTEILKRNYRHMTDDQLTQVLFTLEHAGIIEQIQDGSKTKYKSNE